MTAAASPAYDYGRQGRIGLGTPQANPTVEAEFAILLPRSVSVQATRLVCVDGDPFRRLRAYMEGLPTALASYASMPLSAFGFACTGSSYLLGAKREAEILEGLAQTAGYPVETAARAVLAALQARHISKLALLAPYPEPLLEAAQRYWRSQGLQIVAAAQVATPGPDTQTIYQLSSRDAAKALAALDAKDAQAILLSGTGMPSLACIRDSASQLPVLSSNFCLAWRLLALAGASAHLHGPAPEIAGWRQRLGECLASRDAGHRRRCS